MGLIGAWLGSLYFGCLLVIMPPTAFLTRPVRWLQAIHQYRGTLTASPNFGYELCARRLSDPDLTGLDLSSLRIAFNGAEPVYPDTLQRFSRRFAAFGFRAEAMTPVYGLAEVAVGLTFPPMGRGPIVDSIDRSTMMRERRAVSVAPNVPNDLRFVSCGRPLPGYRLRLLDEAGLEVPERVEGVLQFTGPSATSGYFHNPEATARLVHGEWRDTGDRAYLASGELYITGRIKDMIIRRGQHIYPDEIENAIGELAGVRKGCVVAFGTKEPTTATERLVVLAETRLTDASLRARLNTQINECVVKCIGEPPEEVVLAAPHTVLKTSSGKLRRAATRAAYEDHSLGHAPGRPVAADAPPHDRRCHEPLTTRSCGRCARGIRFVCLVDALRDRYACGRADCALPRTRSGLAPNPSRGEAAGARLEHPLLRQRGGRDRSAGAPYHRGKSLQLYGQHFRRRVAASTPHHGGKSRAGAYPPGAAQFYELWEPYSSNAPGGENIWENSSR